MKLIRLFSMPAFAMAMCLGAVHAQNKPGENLYAGLELGRAKVADETSTITTGLVSALGGSASATQGSSISNYRLFGGYKPNENVGLEVGYVQTSNLSLNFSGVSSGSVAYSGAAKFNFYGLDYSVLLRPSVATGLNDLFFRVGGHSYKAIVDLSATISASSFSASSSESGTGTLFGMGYDLQVAKAADLRISVTRLNKLAGMSDSSATVYSIGLLSHF